MQHDYQLLEEREIGEIRSRARLLEHRPTGAQILSLENDDENKVFGITFRTPPPDSTGVAHILEHSVLCGSRKYPVKDPFVQLLKGSLQTFLNAFTYPDKTCYPCASQHVVDFYHLMDVYLDAVFYPRITRDIFEQEGWHFETDPISGKLNYSGIVFNEMKGVYSSPDSILEEHILQTLFPDTPYAEDSGGRPDAIPNLTYEQFRDFHRRYYHPSNARIFFWGNDDPEERLRRLSPYLNDFTRIDIDSRIPLQVPRARPMDVRRPYPVRPDEKDPRYYTVQSRLLGEITNDFNHLAWQVLSHLLIGTPAAPLRKALIESGLGEDMAGHGLDSDERQLYFAAGLKGVRKEDVPRVHALIDETLRDVRDHGFEEDSVRASLNTMEFSLREGYTGSYPRGLVMMLRSLHLWLYEASPIEALAFEKTLEELKNAWHRDDGLFRDMVGRDLIDNPHAVRLTLEPDPGLSAHRGREERRALDAAAARMSEDERRAIEQHAEDLKKLQQEPDRPEDIARIPFLQPGDLPAENKRIPCHEVTFDGVPFLLHDQATRGIIYVDIGFDLGPLTEDDISFAEVLLDGLLKLGTRTESFVRITQRIGMYTGGIGTSLFTGTRADAAGSERWMHLRAKCLPDQLERLTDILHDILTGLHLDQPDRMGQILREEKGSMESHIIPSGHQMVKNRLLAGFSSAGRAVECLEGIDYLECVRRWIRSSAEDWPSYRDRLVSIFDRIVNRRAMHVNITCEAGDMERATDVLSAWTGGLPAAAPVPHREYAPCDTPAEYLTIPADVHYVGMALPMYDRPEDCTGADLAIARYIRTGWLWEQVRMVGGAYGAFSMLSRRNGLGIFISYRDPHVDRTLQVFDDTAGYLHRLNIDREELNRAIVGAVGDLDAYQFPSAKGYVSLTRRLVGETDEERQRLREEMRGTTAADFKRFAERLDAAKPRGRIAVMGPASGFEQSKRMRAGGATCRTVL